MKTHHILLLLFSWLQSEVNSVPLSSFYFYGNSAGDASLSRGEDDGHSPLVILSESFPFYGTASNLVFVNTNGALTFGSPLIGHSMEAFPVSGVTMIAPFWSDVDIRTSGGGNVFYRQTTDSSLLVTTERIIRSAFYPNYQEFSPTSLFIATWDHVGYYNQHTEKTNTFQCILATDGAQSYVLFLYADGEMQWTSGDASGGTAGLGGTPAQVGLNAGNGADYHSLPGSRTPDVLNLVDSTNAAVSGLWVFKVDSMSITVPSAPRTSKCALQLDNCSPDAECTDTDSDFTCICRAGFTGNGLSCFSLSGMGTDGIEPVTPSPDGFCSVVSTIARTTETEHVEEVVHDILDDVLPGVITSAAATANSTNTSILEATYDALAESIGSPTSDTGYTEFVEALNEIAVAEAAACSSSVMLNITELASEFAIAFSRELTDENLQEICKKFGELLCAESMEQDSPTSSTGTRCPSRGDCTCPPGGINSILTCACEFFACLDPGDHLGPIFGLSRQTQRCLAFIVDTTGSMAEEISAVRTIILDFVRSEEDLNAIRCYILVPFNDILGDVSISVGPVTIAASNDPAELQRFYSAVNALRANGGGDAPEFALDGMLQGLRATHTVDGVSVELMVSGSQMIVLTDAPSLNPHLENTVINEANNRGVCIHFFTSHSGANSDGIYPRVAAATSGTLIDNFANFQLASFISASANTPCGDTSSGSRRRRSTSSLQETFDVSLFTFLIQLSIRASSGATISITQPDGTTATVLASADFAVFSEGTPQPGRWTVCPNFGTIDLSVTQEIALDTTIFILWKDLLSLLQHHHKLVGLPGQIAIVSMESHQISSPELTIGLADGSEMQLALTNCSNIFLSEVFEFPPGTVNYQLAGYDTNGVLFEHSIEESVMFPGLMTCNVDECALGLDNCHTTLANCVDTDTGFRCVCMPGYEGNGVTCNNVDECARGTHSCSTNAHCCDTQGSFSCLCRDGYSGDGKVCTASIKLNPRFGNMLGGTAVLISPGDSLSSADAITCTFGELDISGVRINSTLALCVSPMLDTLGSLKFVLNITGKPELESQYQSISPERGHAVEMSTLNSDILLVPGEVHTITWLPEDLVPESILDGKSITVDISLYIQEHSSLSTNWKLMSRLVVDSPNDGTENFTVPLLSFSCPYSHGGLHFSVCPFAIKVSVSKEQTLPSSIGIWSGVAFLEDSSVTTKAVIKECSSWYVEEIMYTDILRTVQACPPKLSLASSDVEFEREDRSSLVSPSNQYEKDYMEFFHPDIQECYRQNVAERESQQCCYNSEGNLFRGPPSGGSVDSYSPKGNFNLHLLQDLLPYVLCCKAPNTPTCQTYYDVRPSGSETGYELPVPAYVYGDPHIVTLDGHKYTFNGKGEFTLVETLDNTFTLQGRMEAAVDPDGSEVTASVFTAIVAKQLTTDTSVQFEVDSSDPSGSGLRVLVDREEVTFDDISVLEFDDVALLDKRNNTVLALFSSQTNIEVKVENGIISVVKVGLPDDLRGKTRGLMGSLNGIPSDDLVPKGGSKGIPLDSSLEDIHNLFGITWIIGDGEDNFFTYSGGDSWSKFYCPTFSPMFEATFDDPLLEEEARQACGEDEFCLFDIAATKRVEIGVATMNDGATFDRIVEMSVPITCDPPCANGACLEDNICSCNEGYEGDRCTEPIMEECGANDLCENGGTCIQQASSFICLCSPEYEGSLCDIKVPPFHIQFINSSPRVTEESLSVDFVTSKPASSRCVLNSRSADVQRNNVCSSGRIRYEHLPSGQYTFRITSTTSSGERDIVRRRIYIGACAINQINEGLTIAEDAVSLQFVGTRNVTGYQCRLDQAETFEFCRSPVRYEDLSAGEHRLVVKPDGCKGESLSLKFDME